MQNYILNRSWAEVNLDYIAHNVKLIKTRLRRDVEIMGVVKADAYGHGIEATVPILIENGVTRLAVSMLDEAIELRKNNIEVPILVLSYTDPARAEEIIENAITQTVYDLNLAKALSEAGKKLNSQVRVHIKVDTGMGRVGFVSGFDAVKNIIEISKMENIVIEGLYTHFACADEPDDSYTNLQFEKFMSISNELGRLGIQIPIKHVCNSAAAVRFPQMNLDMVRIGILLYGISPSGEKDFAGMDFKPAMTLKTNVIMIKEVEKDQSISYGRTFKTDRPSTIATIPIGYADGFSRTLSNKARVLIKGEYFPVVGTICMDTCMVDITDWDTVDKNESGRIQAGEEVIVFGSDGRKEIAIEELASLMNTINYEVTCLIGRRVPRVYISGNKVINVRNYLLR